MKHIVSFAEQAINTILGVLKEQGFFHSSTNFLVWESPGHRFNQTIVLFSGKEYNGRDYSLVVRQQDHRATLSLYAKQVTINKDNGDVSDHELLLFIVTLGSESTRGERRIIPTYDFKSVAPSNEKQITITTNCMEALSITKIEYSSVFDFKTAIVLTDDTLPPPDLRELFEGVGFIGSEKTKRVA